MDAQSIRGVLVSLHGAAGVIAFFAGGVLIFSRRYATDRRLFGLYWWSLIGLTTFLAGAMVAYWAHYTPASRVTFVGLFVLSLYMLYRAHRARGLLRSLPEGWQGPYIEHIGFTLISLLEGFVIVAVLNAGGAWWLVALVAVAGIYLGRRVIGAAQRRAGPA